MSDLAQDLRFGARALARNYRTTLVSVLSLALGIGAVTSIYSTVSTILMNPVPFPDSDRIVHLFDTMVGRGPEFTSSSYLDFMDYQAQLKDQFEYLGAFSGWDVSFRGPDGPERLKSAGVSSGFFPMLRVQMLLGRAIAPECDDYKVAPEVVITERLWRRAFGASPEIIGKNVELDGEAYTVCGVAPESFRFVMADPADVWMSLGVYKRLADERGNRWLITWGRLRDGVSRDQAEQAFQAVVARLAAEYPKSNAGRLGRLADPGERMLMEFRPALLLLIGAVVLVLAIACVNVANLLLANAAGRRKEIAIRAALGATRGRIIRQLLTESVLLAVLGGVLGILVALWGNSLIISMLPAENRNYYVEYFQFGIRPGVLVVTAGVTVLTGLLFGLAPALEGAQVTLADTLKEGGRGGGGGLRRHRLLSTLVVSEVALALVLLVGAGLLIQSMRNVYTADPGFNKYNMLTFQISMPQPLRSESAQAIHFFERLEERLKRIGGLSAVGAVSTIPFSGDHSTTWITVEGKPEPKPGERPLAGYNVVTPGYFDALGASVLRGRNFDANDRLPESYWEAEKADPKAAPPTECVAVVNETMAAHFWPGEDVLGKRFSQGGGDFTPTWFRVVGVVRDFRNNTAGQPIGPEMYVPLAQRASMDMHFALRGDGPPEARVPEVRQAVLEVDPNQAIAYVKSMEDRIAERAWFSAFIAGVLSAFAAIALLLSAVGVYGVINCSVAQRTHEIGVRMALGADPGRVQRMIVMNGMKLALAGGLIGLAFAFFFARLLQDLLFGVAALDPLTFTAVTVVLMAVAVAASWIPARRATRVNPVVALRYE